MKRAGLRSIVMLLAGAGQLLVAPAAAFSPPAPPQRRSEIVEVVCAGRAISFAIDTDRLGTPRLRAVSYEGVPVANESTARMDALVPRLRGANLGHVTCISATVVEIAISGSRNDMGPGEDDDVIEWFRISVTDGDRP